MVKAFSLDFANIPLQDFVDACKRADEPNLTRSQRYETFWKTLDKGTVKELSENNGLILMWSTIAILAIKNDCIIESFEALVEEIEDDAICVALRAISIYGISDFPIKVSKGDIYDPFDESMRLYIEDQPREVGDDDTERFKRLIDGVDLGE